MKLKEKMITSFLAVAILVVAMNLVTLRNTNHIVSQFDLIMRDTAPSVIALGEIKVSFVEMYNLIERMIESEEKKNVSQHQKALERINKKLMEQETTLEFFSITREEKKFFSQIEKMRHQLYQRGHGFSKGKKIKKASLSQMEKNILSLLHQAGLFQRQKMEQGHRESHQKAAQDQWFNFLFMVSVVLLSLLLGIYTANRISSPIIELKNAAEQVGQGNMDISVNNSSVDEVGILSRSFNEMVENLKRTTVSRDYVDKVLQTMVNILLVLEEGGKIKRVNPSTLETLGYTQEELVGKSICDVLEDCSSFLQELEKGSPPFQERNLLTRSGKRIPVLFSHALMMSPDGSIDGVVCVAQNIEEKKRLEREILEIGDSERLRMAQDLHDGLGQHLGGIKFLCEVFQEKLAKNFSSEAPQAGKIAELLGQALEQTRAIARSLSSIELEKYGLVSALKEFSLYLENIFNISCHFKSSISSLNLDLGTATHLYRIAQEGCHNAVRHGKASTIEIILSRSKKDLTLSIKDDGKGFSQNRLVEGMGIHTMTYRARIIQGALEIRSQEGKGTTVLCKFKE